ncbi:hypothetical protein B0T16DRAFT_394335 [Cercophora newfieldiana]|uniref:Thaumatin-like protein n=1 Tax=Cercophora newfieldiana TaxID=92897 RepID=A0AA40CKX1_9PEZI|nr:hypothetical protein B0T16DRAFT_394335 [Cercophora newfieldiana]
MKFSVGIIALATVVGLSHAAAVPSAAEPSRRSRHPKMVSVPPSPAPSITHKTEDFIATAATVSEKTALVPIKARQTSSSTLTAMTVYVTNAAGVALHTEGRPGAQGTMAAGASDSYTLTHGQNHAIFFNRYDWGNQSDSRSQIESDFTFSGSGTVDKVSLDVSYVAGFTYPIMCECPSPGGKGSGCKTNLWAGSTKCPLEDKFGGCGNPNRDATSPHDWFKDCAGKAYTFRSDSGALSFDQCSDGVFHCTVYGNGK